MCRTEAYFGDIVTMTLDVTNCWSSEVSDIPIAISVDERERMREPTIKKPSLGDSSTRYLLQVRMVQSMLMKEWVHFDLGSECQQQNTLAKSRLL